MNLADSDHLVCVMADCTNTLLLEIDSPEFKRKDVASTYGLAIIAEKYGEKVDWKRVNNAIQTRWSISALNWIKAQAWKRVENAGK